MRRAAHAALFAFLVGVATALAVMPSGRVAHAGEPTETLSIETRERKVTIRIEVARSPGEQARGLMFRRSLADDAGMLFTYDRPQDVHMWMRNTYIPLDMLFIAGNGRIARIAHQTEPFSEETIAAGSDVTAVLEIAGGRARALGIRSGDRVIHAHFAK